MLPYGLRALPEHWLLNGCIYMGGHSMLISSLFEDNSGAALLLLFCCFA